MVEVVVGLERERSAWRVCHVPDERDGAPIHNDEERNEQDRHDGDRSAPRAASNPRTAVAPPASPDEPQPVRNPPSLKRFPKRRLRARPGGTSAIQRASSNGLQVARHWSKGKHNRAPGRQTKSAPEERSPVPMSRPATGPPTRRNELYSRRRMVVTRPSRTVRPCARDASTRARNRSPRRRPRRSCPPPPLPPPLSPP